MCAAHEITDAPGASEAQPDPAAAVAAAERADAAASANRRTHNAEPGQWRFGRAGENRCTATERYQAEMSRLVDAIPECRSTALARAIEAVIEAKGLSFQAALADDETDTEDSIAAYNAARDQLQNAAHQLAEAPIANATDALIRAECFIDAVDRSSQTGLPEDDNGDRITLISSLKSGIEWLALQEPDRTIWDEVVAAYRRSRHDVDVAYREQAGLKRAASVEPHVRADVAARLNVALGAQDKARTSIMGMEPPDVGGLLVQMEVLAERFAVDLRTYTSREVIVSDQVFTAEQFWDDMDDKEALRRALGLLAVNASKLRDRAYPTDWRAILDGFLSVHEGGRDAVRAAYDARLAAADLLNVVLDPRNNPKQPVLLFRTPHGKAIQARPGEVWIWEEVR